MHRRMLEMFRKHDGRKCCKWSHYPEIYERHFSRFVGSPVVVFEIGVDRGGSLQLWKNYFGGQATVVGIDINPSCRFDEDQIHVEIGDQADRGFLAQVVDRYGNPHIVIDDGGHRPADVLASFAFLYPRMNETGVYLIEDLHVSYWPEFDGGLCRRGTVIETAKELIDYLNHDYTRGQLPFCPPLDFTRATGSISFYDSVAVFERKPNRPKEAIEFGGA
jgi:cephalosporin hydroxylase